MRNPLAPLPALLAVAGLAGLTALTGCGGSGTDAGPAATGAAGPSAASSAAAAADTVAPDPAAAAPAGNFPADPCVLFSGDDAAGLVRTAVGPAKRMDMEHARDCGYYYEKGSRSYSVHIGVRDDTDLTPAAFKDLSSVASDHLKPLAGLGDAAYYDDGYVYVLKDGHAYWAQAFLSEAPEKYSKEAARILVSHL